MYTIVRIAGKELITEHKPLSIEFINGVSKFLRTIHPYLASTWVKADTDFEMQEVEMFSIMNHDVPGTIQCIAHFFELEEDDSVYEIPMFIIVKSEAANDEIY